MRMHRTLALLCLLCAGCATAGTDTEAGSTITLSRPDGSPAVCSKPPSAWLDSQEGVGVAAAVPDLVELLTGTSTKDSKKLDTVVRDAPTKEALGVLDYRLCLEYANGTLGRDVYTEWLLDLRPRAYKAALGLQKSH
jgi:hypothetical protein